MSTGTSGRVVIGMDPHKRSAAIEVMTIDETILGSGRFTTDGVGDTEMRRYARQWPDRVWAIEGCARGVFVPLLRGIPDAHRRTLAYRGQQGFD